ncbi:MAG: hypothetical protein AAFY88_15320 [Acidobacteriota bacterium]
MQRIHLLQVEADADVFAPLIAELARRGERAGWLDWRPGDDAQGVVTGPLADAADLGVLRAVSVDRSAAVSIKPASGPAVLRDVVREYFRGCRAVLVRSASPVQALDGGGPIPVLCRDGERFRVERGGGRFELDAVELSDRLRRVRPFRTDVY